MKFRNLLFATLLIVGTQFCFGQEIPSSNLLEPKPPMEFKISSIQPYYVLKADDKSIGIISTEDNKFELSSIEAELISRMEVIKGKNATDQYGVLGANGVIVITFKNYATLPKELKDRFRDTE